MNPNLRIKNNPYSAPQYYYPLELGSEGREPYVIFDIRDSVAIGGASKGTIALYMPADIKSSYRAGYEDASFGILGLDFSYGDLAEKAADAISSAGTAAGNILSSPINNGIGALTKGLSSLWENKERVAGSAKANAVALGISKIAREQRDRAKIVNPHQAVLFQGMGFRTFNLNFTLIAKSPEESDMINNIIYTFKYHMHPAVGADGEGFNRYLLYPENFVIGFYSPSPKYLFQVSPCVLESMDVDYAGAGKEAFFGDTGAPVQINLGLSFKETEVLTKDRIKDGL